MRIRTIKPEFWRSDDIAALSIEDRLLFIGLWSYVEDNGVGRDECHLIAADLFAADMYRDSRETVARISRGLSHLSEAGLIVRYATENRGYIEITSWKRHQKVDRPGKSSFPQYDPDRHTLAKDSRDCREELAPGTGNREQGTGNREQGVSASGDSDANRISDEPKRDDVERVVQHMAESVQNRTGRKPRSTRGWRDSARLMLDRDGIPEADIHAAIDWSANDDFWHKNILSVPKLREKYDQLSLQAASQTRPRNRPLGLVQPTSDEETQAIVNRIYTPPLLAEILAAEAHEQAEKEATT